MTRKRPLVHSVALSESPLRSIMRDAVRTDEGTVLQDLVAAAAAIERPVRERAGAQAAALVRTIRDGPAPGLTELFLNEFGLSTEEGIALMCLAEALLRVPDDETIDALIEDKIASSAWGEHFGRSSSSLINASTWALMLTGAILRDDDSRGLAGILHDAMKRLGEPVIRVAVSRAMKELGSQFVLGRDIGEAVARARDNEAAGYTYSYDMLGEAARTEADAQAYHREYASAIRTLASICTPADIRGNPGISVKLSALHPRYESAQRDRVLAELVPRTRSLARAARSAGMGFNIDAEEADRLDLSLDVIEAVLADSALAGWDGFGVVVQAYGKRARHVLDWLYDLAGTLDRRIMCRLVKGAYWDTEIKRAQVLGLDGYPVFTRKPTTDVSYIVCAEKLLGMTDRVYPQFATHNAHTVATILELAGPDRSSFEFQRLHGMGEALHDIVLRSEGTRCRIYAPVGEHKELLAYLVRRLLENGSNSSFVNQIIDHSVTAETVAADPFAAAEAYLMCPANPRIALPGEIFGPGRRNSAGWDLSDPRDMARFDALRAPFRCRQWTAGPVLSGPAHAARTHVSAKPAESIGENSIGKIRTADAADIDAAIVSARCWDAAADSRAQILVRAADLYEAHTGEIAALLAREAGKTPTDCVGELREAVDFLRYYAAEARPGPAGQPRGIFACISPWNFPLAIFTGQIAAALATGNAVIAKPAEQTPLIAGLAVALLHEAGVPLTALQLLPGGGDVVGAAIVSDSRIAGVCFTGSTATAQAINRAMADNLAPDAPLIAETGGLNAMIVDSTALAEQAVRDIVASAFQSAGQRCSALRMLYVQDDIAEGLLTMLFGAMDELRLGDPWQISTDIGPIIDAAARAKIVAHIDAATRAGRVLKKLSPPADGLFVGPAVLRIAGIADLAEEIFGPVLHVATFAGGEIDRVIDDINRSGYGLTFGVHTRIDGRVQRVIDLIRAGNIYVNRNQIGAVVGSQPFGGEGLSGTGPKAGGPHYLPRFCRPPPPSLPEFSGVRAGNAPPVDITAAAVAAAVASLPTAGDTPVSALTLPGPTGESNRLYLYPRGVVLCLGPTAAAAAAQADTCRAAGCVGLAIAPGVATGLDGILAPPLLCGLAGIDAVVFWGVEGAARELRRALAMRDGPIVPLICDTDFASRLTVERHVCVDITASGGNAALLAAGGG